MRRNMKRMAGKKSLIKNRKFKRIAALGDDFQGVFPFEDIVEEMEDLSNYWVERLELTDGAWILLYKKEDGDMFVMDPHGNLYLYEVNDYDYPYIETALALGADWIDIESVERGGAFFDEVVAFIQRLREDIEERALDANFGDAIKEAWENMINDISYVVYDIQKDEMTWLDHEPRDDEPYLLVWEMRYEDVSPNYVYDSKEEFVNYMKENSKDPAAEDCENIFDCYKLSDFHEVYDEMVENMLLQYEIDWHDGRADLFYDNISESLAEKDDADLVEWTGALERLKESAETVKRTREKIRSLNSEARLRRRASYTRRDDMDYIPVSGKWVYENAIYYPEDFTCCDTQEELEEWFAERDFMLFEDGTIYDENGHKFDDWGEEGRKLFKELSEE